LSGGEKQRVAIAAALALRPEILVLDEPTSQLDPKSAEDVLNALARLNADLGLTIILAEHRLERVLPFVDQVLWLPGGDAVPELDEPRPILAEMPATPPLVQVAKRLGWSPLPLTIKEGLRHSRRWLADHALSSPRQTDADSHAEGAREALVRAEQITVHYGSTPVLHQVD